MRYLLRCFFAFAALVSFAAASRAADETRVFELRIYETNPGKLETLLKRFREHTCTLFERHGMTNIGYWLPINEADGAGNKLVYMLAYPNRNAAKSAWAAFRADPEWQSVQKASEANGALLVHAPQSIFLQPTDYSPVLQAAASKGENRVFELRTYTTPEGKLDALHTRFRDHTRAIFQTHDMTSVGYWTPLDENQGAGHTLTYMLAFPNYDAAKKSWTEFRADPDWVKAKAASEKEGPLTVTNGVKSVFLKPTDFSPIQ